MKTQIDTGINLAYDEKGAGEVLLFVHGFPHNRTLWTRQLTALSPYRRCITVDLRGFGESSDTPPYSMDQYADDIAALLRKLGVARATFAGISMGGYVLFALLRRHPQLVSGLILADTRAGADDAEGKVKREGTIVLARSNGPRAVADAQIEGMLGKSTRAKSPDLVDAVYRMLAAAPLNGLVGAVAAMRDRPDSTATVAAISVPTLIITGEEDVLTPPKEARRMHELIAGSTLSIIPEAGHLSNVEQPDAFNAQVAAFLTASNTA